jgi:hypothetical protein
LANASTIFGVDLAGCSDACATTAGCVGLALSGTACYLKGTITPGEYNAAVNSAVLVGTSRPSGDVITVDPASVSTPSALSPPGGDGGNGIQCPAADRTYFTSSCGATYAIGCSTDIPGNDSKWSFLYPGLHHANCPSKFYARIHS